VSALFAEDRHLVRRLLSGDEDTFSEFFDLQAPRLYRFALARLDYDPDAAEEVVQSTLIKVFPKLHTYRAEAPLFTWLCTFCRREIGAWFRAKQRSRRQETVLTDHAEIQAALSTLGELPFESPQHRLLRKELSLVVQSTLDCLPRRYGEVLEWKYAEGLSVREIADRLGVGFAAAQSMLARARAAFRKGFGPLAPALAGLTAERGRS
jgi:RNA polymerase sigma-70 factor (ECF subfamily)